MTRKEYVLQIVEELKTNPRAVLAGHGIQASVLQTIVARPDVLSKLATILYSTVYAKKGAKGLKAAKNFKISGYKNFGNFNLQAREDVETFIGGLSPEDAATFTNNENILTILMLPQQPIENVDDTVTNIISGKSVGLTFDVSVRKEYKLGNGMYLTIMFGDSAMRKTEEAVALRTANSNIKKEIRRTPAKIAAELRAKTNKKLAVLKAQRKELETTAFNTSMELEQLNALEQNPEYYGSTHGNNSVIRTRKAELEAEIMMIQMDNIQKMEDLALAPNESRKLSLQSMISKNNTKIKQLRAKAGTYNNISATGIKNKARLLQQTHKLIEANIAKGQAISNALKNALSSLALKPVQQELIRQDVMQQVAAGTPMQYAVQQSLQANVGSIEDDLALPATSLSGNYDIDALMAAL